MTAEKMKDNVNDKVVKTSPYAPLASQRQVTLGVRQFFRNEFLLKLAEEEGRQSGKYWGSALEFFRAEMSRAMEKIIGMTNVGHETMIDNIISKKVSLALGRWNRDPDKLDKMVQAAIEKEVQRQVKERLSIRADATITVDVRPDRYKDEAQF